MFFHSPTISLNSAVVSDNPQATLAGIEILRKGGNAADAAVATMTAVSVVQPNTCGIGGDVFCLFYRKSDKTVHALNGSTRTGEKATLDKVIEAGIIDPTAEESWSHGLWTSTPGAVSAMFNTIKHFGSGKMTMKEIFTPAVELAENGVSMPPKASSRWNESVKHAIRNKNAADILMDNQISTPGDVMYNPKLARCLKEISEKGAEAFYCGDVARNVVKTAQEAGGVLTLGDMKNYYLNSPSNAASEAAFVDFRGFRIWEVKPNTTGIVALVMLNILREYDLKGMGHNSANYIHVIVEATKYAYQECSEYLCDPDFITKSLDVLLSQETAERLRSKIDSTRVCQKKIQSLGGNTSYVAVVDSEGNGCSFICSICDPFGTGLVPDDCGFFLHDRLKCMSLNEDSPNAYGPNKLPLHTIIPALVTDASTGDLIAVVGHIGLWMQPQGQVQVLLNMIIFGMDPQMALTQPRFFVGDVRSCYEKQMNSLNELYLEKGIDLEVENDLLSKGHRHCRFSNSTRNFFGAGHVIARPKLFGRHFPNNKMSENAWWSGFDIRSDGCAMGF